MKMRRKKATNCKINPILYDFYLRLKDTLGAEMVHRRRRKSATCIEIVFYNDLYRYLKGRLNTLKEAEKWGFWVICRAQTKRGHGVWHGRAVYQLFLTPVHPKKRRESLYLAQQAEEVTFEPVIPVKIRTFSPQYLHICKKMSTFAADFENLCDGREGAYRSVVRQDSADV